MKTTSLAVILFLISAVGASADNFLIVDYVSAQSECGAIARAMADSVYSNCEIGYDTTFIGHEYPDVAVFVTGVAGYGQGHYLNESELAAIRLYLTGGGKALVFGLNNIANLPPRDYLGCEMISRDPWQTDSLWGCSGSILDGMVLMYDESNYRGAYYMMESNPDAQNCLEAQYGMSGSPRAVQYENRSNGSKTVTVNMDLALITEGRNSAEDLIRRIFHEQFGYDPTGVPNDDGGLPGDIELLHNYPNPFNVSTTIYYRLAANNIVELSIYNLLGEKIAEPVHEVQSPGEYRRIWDGKNSDGGEIPSGIYFYKLTTGQFELVRRMTVVK